MGSSHPIILTFFILPLLAGAQPAQAQTVADAKRNLASNQHDQVEAGIQTLGLIGTADAVEPLVERIRQGLPPNLLETAIFTLMALGQPSAAPILNELTTHRRPAVRLRAVEAIVAVKAPGAEATLVSALSDSDPKVRSAAAVGLGDVGSSQSLDVLFHALDRGNMEASTAIGKVVAAGQVDRLLGYLGKIPFRSLSPALSEVLRRADVPEKAKLSVVARLQEVATPEAKSFMGDIIAAHGPALGTKLNRTLLNAMQQIAD